MPRLFTALEIPADVGQSLALLRGGLPGARWIDPENYHLTLRFIGDVDDVLARDVAYLLGGIRRPAFRVQLDGLDSFGGHKPRAVVAPAQPVRELIELQAEHERLMQRGGLEPGGKYKPHVAGGVGGRGAAGAGAHGAAGRARAADAAGRARAGAQVQAACDARPAARCVEPAGRGLTREPAGVPPSAVSGVAVRALLLA